MNTIHTYGAEIEKALAQQHGQEPHCITADFFLRIAAVMSSRGHSVKIKHSDIRPDVVLGVHDYSFGEIGLDNGYNLQETATRVVETRTVASGLRELQVLLTEDLSLVQAAAAAEQATVINMSIHPFGRTTPAVYRKYVAPKSIYRYLHRRGWDHAAGIDAKAQNSPSTGVRPQDAARAATVMIGSGAAVIGVFANSPFAAGAVSGYRETRLAMWDRMMKNALSPGDRKTAAFPEAPFLTLRDYFVWMFGPGTHHHFVVSSGGSYKSFADSAVLIKQNPSTLEYLGMSRAEGEFLHSGAPATVIPHLRDLETVQFAQFTGARVRFGFNHDRVTTRDFLSCLNKNLLEELFADGAAAFTYIEGRDAGANFPDAELRSIDRSVAESTYISPSALQAGLLNNLEEAHRYISSFPWQQLGVLREQSMRHGLEGSAGSLTVYAFTKEIIAIARRGLPRSAHGMLRYPEYVLETRQNGADRALAAYARGKTIAQILEERHVITG